MIDSAVINSAKLVALVLVPASMAIAQLNQNCTVSILNRTSQVAADGTWAIPNVPAGFGPVRARATCVQGGVTQFGQSDFISIKANQITGFNAKITLGVITPIPQSITITAPSSTLSGPGATMQLTVTGGYTGGGSADLTSSPGTIYSTSNPAIATVSPTGLVTAVSGGNFVVRASNEGAAGLLFLSVAGVGNISGTVFHSDGVTTVPSARVGLYNNFPNGFVAASNADAHGVYSFTGIPLGTFTLDVSDPATGDAARTATQLTVNGQTQISNIVLNGVGTVIVTVKSTTGSVVPNAQVSVTSQTIFGGTLNTTAGANGVATVNNVLAGAFTATATDPISLGSATVNASITAGGTANVTITLQTAGATISGTLFLPDGVTPLPGNTVRVLDSSNAVVQQTVSGPSGAFQFIGLPSGTYTLDSIDITNRVQAKVSGVTVVSGGVYTQNLVLTPLGTVTGQVRNPNSTPAPNVNVALFSGSGVSGGTYSKLTDGSGNFTFTDVALGGFSITANDPANQLQGVATGTVTGGQTVSVNVQLASLAPPATNQGIITTVAGSTAVFQGAGGPPTSATLGTVQAVAVDSTGNVYIADQTQHMVTKVSNGILTILAGTGTAGYSGDGELAVNALLNSPQNVAVDSNGNVYIADASNQRIRKVDTAGRISTVAGNGISGFAGDGGPATLAAISSPHGVAVDTAGNLYISDTNNHRIRKVNTSGIITTIAGDGFKDANGFGRFAGDNGPAVLASLNLPESLAVDPQGTIFVADAVNGRIRKINAAGTITTFAGGAPCCALGDGGPATSAYFQLGANNAGITNGGPSGVAVDGTGNVYIADTFHARIRKVDSTGTINTVAGSGTFGFLGDGGPATAAQIAFPPSVSVSGTTIYIADQNNFRVRKVTAGTITTFAGAGFGFAGDGGPATSALMNGPDAVAVDSANDIFISDSSNYRVRKVTAAGIISTFAGNGIRGFRSDGLAPTATSLDINQGVTIDAAGETIIADTRGHRIRKVNAAATTVTTIVGNGTGSYNGDNRQATTAEVKFPFSPIYDSAGNLYFADQGNHRVRKVNTSGVITTVAGDGNARFFGDGGLATNASLNLPQSVAVDSAGNLYIADTGNGKIRKVGTNGVITTIAGNGAITSGTLGDGGPALAAAMSPVSVILDGAGNIYIADTEFNRVRKILSDGTILTVAGGGAANLSPFGDGGPATGATLSSPQAVALDTAGNLYIADTNRGRIRNVTGATAPVSFFVQPNLSVTLPVGGSATEQVPTSASFSGLPWTATASTSTGSGWLSVTSTGTTPGALAVTFTGTNLVPGVYSGTVTVHAPLSASPTITIAVTLTIQPAATPPGPTVTETAGSSFVFSGANGPALNATLSAVHNIAVDAAGNLFLADQNNNYVFKVTPAGTLSIVAGNGRAANSADGVVAASSSLNSPQGVAVDMLGNVYIAETNNHKIRKIDSSGTLSTVAGVGGTQNFSGDGGPAIQAALAFPQAVTVDSAGNLYISDTGNSRVRKVDTGGFINTIAGTGTFGFGGDGGPAIFATMNRPSGVALDGAGNIYISDKNNNRIRQIDSTGNMSTLITNAVAEVTTDSSGKLYFTDGSTRIFRVDGPSVAVPVAGNGVAAFGGDGGPALSASLNGPQALVFDTTGNLYIADSSNFRIRKVNTSGTIATIAGNGNYKFGGDGGQATSAFLSAPGGVAVDAQGNIFVADSSNHRIRKITSAGVISTIAGNGSPGFFGDGGAATSAALNNPRAVAVDAAGNVYVADGNNRRVRKVATNGIISTIAGNGGTAFPGDGLPAVDSPINSPASLALDSAGNLYIADSGNLRVFKMDTSGILHDVAGNGNRSYTGDGGPAASASFNAPFGVAVDSAGNLYIADNANGIVRKLAPNGIITTVAGNGIIGFTDDGVPAVSSALNNPRAVAVDASGNLYIADAGNQRIRKVSVATGLITTVGGSGAAGRIGDGGLAVLGGFNSPFGLAVDSAGNIYVADTSDDRIRKIGQ